MSRSDGFRVNRVITNWESCTSPSTLTAVVGVLVGNFI
jgi:hypothetical protein